MYVHDVTITLCAYRLCIIVNVLYICMYDGLKNNILKYLDKQKNKKQRTKKQTVTNIHKLNI